MRGLARIALLFASVALGWQGRGAPLDLGAACDCDDGCGDEGATAEIDHGDSVHEADPQECQEDCPCCATATMIAGVPGLSIRPAGRSHVTSLGRAAPGRTSGDHDGVYRPPRA